MKFTVLRDNINTNSLYTLRGTVVDTGSEYGQKRWIQFNINSRDKNPIMITRPSYTSYGAICFDSYEQAMAFLYNFISSDKRQNNYEVSWKVSRVAPNFGKGAFHEVDTIYGRCLERVSY